jgi:UDP-glucose 4-epimerase
VLLLSQALRRLQRATVPLPSFAVSGVGSLLRSTRLADFSPEQLGFITFGRGVDTTRMRELLGFHPAYTTAEAFADFGSSITPTGGHSVRALDGLSRALAPSSTSERPTRELVGADRG